MNRIRQFLSDYYQRIMDVPGRLEDVAWGFAIGTFIAFSPWIGLHTVLVILITLAARKSLAAGLLGSLVFNPLTGAFVYAAEFELGRRLVGSKKLHLPAGLTFDFAGLRILVHEGFEVLYPLLIGSLIIGAAASVLSFFLVRNALRTYRARVLRRGAR